MIDKEMVEESYKKLMDFGFNVREALVKNIYQVAGNMNVEEADISKETLLRVKFIVELHNEIIANILEDNDKFTKKPGYFQDNFYRSLDYLSLYKNVDVYQHLISQYEDTYKLMNDDESIMAVSSFIPDAREYVENGLIVVNHEMDNLEESLASDLVKILGKRKER